jgi:hypothetical protein
MFHTAFGFPVVVEDINNDGYIDLLTGGQLYDRGRGRVYLFWGGETMNTEADVTFEGEDSPDGKPIITDGERQFERKGWFGRKIDAGGDVDGDGHNDILIGARHFGGKENNGSAYLFLGDKKEKMDAFCDCYFRGENRNDEMGASLELFDINNDGFSEVIVGSRFAARRHGEVHIWWGGKDFNGNRNADIVLQGEHWSSMGCGDIHCSDFNGDGYGDILVSAVQYPSNKLNHGRVYLFYGNDKNIMDTDCDYIFDTEEQTKYFGGRLSWGDVNNDGYIDVLLGHEGQKNIINGAVFLYFGPFATEDLQDKIKAQQKRVKEVEQQLSEAKQRLSSMKK